MEIIDIEKDMNGVRFVATCQLLDSYAMMIRTKAPVAGITLIEDSYDRSDMAVADDECLRNHVVEVLKKLQVQYELVKRHITKYRSLNRYNLTHEETMMNRLDKDSPAYQESVKMCRMRLNALYIRNLQRAFPYEDIDEVSPYFIRPYLLDQLVKHII